MNNTFDSSGASIISICISDMVSFCVVGMEITVFIDTVAAREERFLVSNSDSSPELLEFF